MTEADRKHRAWRRHLPPPTCGDIDLIRAVLVEAGTLEALDALERVRSANRILRGQAEGNARRVIDLGYDPEVA